MSHDLVTLVANLIATRVCRAPTISFGPRQFQLMVHLNRVQVVGGSNPLAPTN